MTVTVKRLGGSVAVVIPKSLARDAGLVEGSTLDISTEADAIVMRKRPSLRPRRPIDQITAKIKPAAYRRRSREFSADRPQGREHA